MNLPLLQSVKMTALIALIVLVWFGASPGPPVTYTVYKATSRKYFKAVASGAWLPRKHYPNSAED